MEPCPWRMLQIASQLLILVKAHSEAGRACHWLHQWQRTCIDAIELELGVDVLLLDLLVGGNVDTG